MKQYTTSIKAIDPRDGHIKKWCGPHVPAESFEEAERYCQENGLGYCKVDGELIEEIPISQKEFEAIVNGIAKKN